MAPATTKRSLVRYRLVDGATAGAAAAAEFDDEDNVDVDMDVEDVNAGRAEPGAGGSHLTLQIGLSVVASEWVATHSRRSVDQTLSFPSKDLVQRVKTVGVALGTGRVKERTTRGL